MSGVVPFLSKRSTSCKKVDISNIEIQNKTSTLWSLHLAQAPPASGSCVSFSNPPPLLLLTLILTFSTNLYQKLDDWYLPFLWQADMLQWAVGRLVKLHVNSCSLKKKVKLFYPGEVKFLFYQIEEQEAFLPSISWTCGSAPCFISSTTIWNWPCLDTKGVEAIILFNLLAERSPQSGQPF